MATQKGYKTDINLHLGKEGPARRQEILDGITEKSGFLPKGVLTEDMDAAFIEFVKTDLGITLEGEKVPVNFFTIQRWMEFSQTWENSDKYKNMKIPFITIVKKPDMTEGTNQAGLWNIAGNRTYTYIKVPTWNGNRAGIDTYKIPQPTPIDLAYEVRLFTNRMKDLNKLTETIMVAFQSKQFYISVKGHPMPVLCEGTSDESNIDDFENRRYYVISFEMKLLGYIMREEDFEVIPTINRAMVTFETNEEKPFNTTTFDPIVRGSTLTYSILFKSKAEPEFSFRAPYDMTYNQLINIENISRIIIKINGVGVFDGTVLTTPIIVQADDVVTIRIFKNYLVVGKFQLLGNT